MPTTPEPLAAALSLSKGTSLRQGSGANSAPQVTFPDMPPLSDEALSDSGTHTWYREQLSESEQATQSGASQHPFLGQSRLGADIKQILYEYYKK